MQERQEKKAAAFERSIDITRLFRLLLKRVWVILLVSVLVAAAVFAGSKLFMAPQYRSSFTAYVNNRQTTDGQSVNSTDITTSKYLTYLYQEIILSRSVLLDAAEQCGLEYSYSTLRSRVSTSIATNAAIISVSVEAEDPKEAEQLAAAIAVAAPEHVARVVEGSSMRIVDYPVLPQAPSAPHSTRMTVVGFLAAFLVSALAVIFSDIVTDKVESAREMEERYDIAVVGVIPNLLHSDKHEYGTKAEQPRRN